MKVMTDMRDAFYTPLYLCATYLSPKWGPRALLNDEKLAVIMYIKDHVKVEGWVDFIGV